MANESQYLREEEAILEAYARGEITREEHLRQIGELWRDYRAAAEEAAENAYRRELDNW